MADTRIYIATDLDADPPKHWLVRAPTSAQARNHVTHNRFVVDVATQETIVDMLEKGVKVENATGRAVAE